VKRRVLLALAVAVAACAPMRQTPARPQAGFAGPRLEGDAVVSFDGARLGLTRWEADGEPKAVIVGVHGMDDYANAFHLAAPAWAARGIVTLAYDQRGFGRSPQRGIWASNALYTEDLRTVVALARRAYPAIPVVVAGESFGGAVAIEAFSSDRPPDADRLVLLAPAVWGWSTQPWDYALALRAANLVAPGWVLMPPSWVTRKISASDNRQELMAMGRDPLMTFGNRVDAVYGLVSIMEDAWRDLGRLRLPVLYLYGAHDEIIPAKPSRQAAARLGPEGRTLFYSQGWHLLLRDRQAPRVWDDVAAFVLDPGRPAPSGAPPIAGSVASPAVAARPLGG
jgi:alpha-beta hydrolase superfamily lysophospholipase